MIKLLDSSSHKLKAPLAGLFAGLWLADTATTISLVSQFGVEMEANKLMRWVMVNWGIGGFTAVKAGTLWLWLTLHQKAHVVCHIGLAAVMGVVVYLNAVMAWS